MACDCTFGDGAQSGMAAKIVVEVGIDGGAVAENEAHDAVVDAGSDSLVERAAESDGVADVDGVEVAGSHFDPVAVCSARAEDSLVLAALGGMRGIVLAVLARSHPPVLQFSFATSLQRRPQSQDRRT